MKPGSVIVDLAAEAGGNCELTRPGETYATDGGVKIAGAAEPAVGDGRARVRAVRAQHPGLIELGFDFDDEVVEGACVVREGKVVEAWIC